MDDLQAGVVVPIPVYNYASVWNALMLSVTGYNIVIHLLYKKLHDLMGKLLLLYSIFLAVLCVSQLLMLTFVYVCPISINRVCYTIKFVFITTYIGYGTIATCILAHSAYHMRQSYKMIPTNPWEDKVAWRRYLCYIIGTIAIAMLI